MDSDAYTITCLFAGFPLVMSGGMFSSSRVQNVLTRSTVNRELPASSSPASGTYPGRRVVENCVGLSETAGGKGGMQRGCSKR